MAAELLIRPRTDADLPQCEVLARRVHDRDGYPPYLPDEELLMFLAGGPNLGAWVAVETGRLVGHVALRPASSEPVMTMASAALGCERETLAVVARLLVEPTDRRRGIGAKLMTTAVDEARDRRLRPILDVVTHFEPAVRLYESMGWRRLGQVTLRLPDGNVLEEFVFAAG